MLLWRGTSGLPYIRDACVLMRDMGTYMGRPDYCDLLTVLTAIPRTPLLLHGRQVYPGLTLLALLSFSVKGEILVTDYKHIKGHLDQISDSAIVARLHGFPKRLLLKNAQ